MCKDVGSKELECFPYMMWFFESKTSRERKRTRPHKKGSPHRDRQKRRKDEGRRVKSEDEETEGRQNLDNGID